jgi:hypothetical protein
MHGGEQYKGEWWLPESPEQTLFGTLTVSNGGGKLELLGNFGLRPISTDDVQEMFSSFDLDERRRIVGKTSTKDEITIEGRGIATPGDLSIYALPWTLIGKSFTADEAIVFDEMAVEISDLDQWVGVTGIQTSKLDPTDPEAWTQLYDVKFKPPESIKLALDNGEHLTIAFRTSRSSWIAVTTTATVSQTTRLELRFARPHTLHELAERVGQLRRLLCLATGRPVSVLSVTGFQHDYRHPERGHLLPIRILWEIPENPDPPAEPRHPFQMPFTLERAPDGAAALFNRWFALDAKYEHTTRLYFAMRYQRDGYGDLRFLVYAQALEIFDRRQRETRSTPSQRLRAMLKQCSLVRSRILESAHVSLEELTKSFQDSRDFYTHFNPDERDIIVRGVPLYVLSVQIQATIEMGLFRELGFSCDEINTIFEIRTPRYREIRHAYEYGLDDDVAVPGD